MSLRDEFKDKTIKNSAEIEYQERRAFEKEFSEFIDQVLAKGFAEWVFELVKQDVRLNISKGYISESFFRHTKMVKNELAVGPNADFGQRHYIGYRHAFPDSLKKYFEKNSMKYWTSGGYKYNGLTFSTFINELTVLYIEGLFFKRVKNILAEKLKEEEGLSTAGTSESTMSERCTICSVSSSRITESMPRLRVRISVSVM